MSFKITFLLVILVLADNTINAQPLFNPGEPINNPVPRISEWIWGNQAFFSSGSSFDDSESEAIATDTEGNSYVIGSYTGDWSWDGITLIETGSNADVYLIKYNKDGEVLWAKRSNGGEAFARDVALSPSGEDIYITGEYRGPTMFDHLFLPATLTARSFLVKYDNDGNVQWAKWNAGPGNAFPTAVDVDPVGNVYMGGRFSDTINWGLNTLMSPQSIEVFVTKFDEDGNFLWTQQSVAQTVNITSSTLEDLTIDNQGCVYITGGIGDTVSFGIHTFTTNLLNKFYVVKYSPDGIAVGAIQAAPEGGLNSGSALTVDESLNVYAAINYSDEITLGNQTLTTPNNNALYAKFNALGEVQWILNDEGSGFSAANDIIIDAVNNQVYATGSASVNNAVFGSKVVNVTSISGVLYLLKIRAIDGNAQWVKQDFSDDKSVGSGVGIDANYNIYVSGSVQRVPIFLDNQGMFLPFFNQGPFKSYGIILKTNTGTTLLNKQASNAKKPSTKENFKVFTDFDNKAIQVANANIANQPSQINVSLFDRTGKLMIKQSMEGETNTIDVSRLPSGVYILYGISNSGEAVFSEKLLVQ